MFFSASSEKSYPLVETSGSALHSGAAAGGGEAPALAAGSGEGAAGNGDALPPPGRGLPPPGPGRGPGIGRELFNTIRRSGLSESQLQELCSNLLSASAQKWQRLDRIIGNLEKENTSSK